MTRLRDDATSETYLQALIFGEAAVSAYPGVETFAAPLTRQIEGFEPLRAVELELMREEQKILALVRIRDLVLDMGLRELQIDVLAEVRNDRSAPAYQRLYKDGIGQVTSYGLSRQIEVGRDAVRALTESDGLYSQALVDKHKPLLEEAIAQGEAVQAARATHEQRAANHRLKVQDWKLESRRALQAVEGELLSYGARRGLKKDWVRSFFA